MSTSLDDRVAAVSAALEQARQRLVTAQAAVTDARAREQAALLQADMAAAERAREELSNALLALPAATAAVDSLELASKALAVELRETQHRDQLQQIEDTLTVTRIELDGLVRDAIEDVEKASTTMARALQVERDYVALQGRRREMRTAVGLDPFIAHPPPPDQPVQRALRDHELLPRVTRN